MHDALYCRQRPALGAANAGETLNRSRDAVGATGAARPACVTHAPTNPSGEPIFVVRAVSHRAAPAQSQSDVARFDPPKFSPRGPPRLPASLWIRNRNEAPNANETTTSASAPASVAQSRHGSFCDWGCNAAATSLDVTSRALEWAYPGLHASKPLVLSRFWCSSNRSPLVLPAFPPSCSLVLARTNRRFERRAMPFGL